MTPTGPSVHLSWAELQCHDEFKTPYPIAKFGVYRPIALAAAFESLRVACGRRLGTDPGPLAVISAYRTPEHNKSVGGAGASQHVEGTALDLAPPHGMDVEGFGAVCLEQARLLGLIRGVGIYAADGHVHIDIRPEEALATWRG